MDISIKKDLASNWFKLLQNAICDDILKIEKNKVNFQSTSWNRSSKKDEGGGESVSYTHLTLPTIYSV